MLGPGVRGESTGGLVAPEGEGEGGRGGEGWGGAGGFFLGGPEETEGEREGGGAGGGIAGGYGGQRQSGKIKRGGKMGE